MHYGKNTQKYFDLVCGEAGKMMRPHLKKGDKELGEVMINVIADGEGPRTVKRNHSPKVYFISNKLFRPLSEIIDAVDTIENIAIIIRSFPYKRQGISPVKYLKCHVENYFNELYILKSRMVSSLKLIERSYKKSDISEEVVKTVSTLLDIVSKIFDGYIKTRGAHIHEFRYSDADFTRMTMLELLSLGDKKDKFNSFMAGLSKEAYRALRQKWVKKIKVDLKGIYDLLELYFEKLLSVLSENGSIIFPKGMGWV